MLHICQLQKFGTCQQISFLGKTSSLSGPKKLSPEKSFIPGKDDLKDLIGSYYSIECGGEYTLALQNDSLWMVDHAQKKMFMQPVSKNVLKPMGTWKLDLNLSAQISKCTLVFLVPEMLSLKGNDGSG